MPWGNKRAQWDTVLARKLWDQGLGLGEMSERLGVTARVISSYRRRLMWPDRDTKDMSQANEARRKKRFAEGKKAEQPRIVLPLRYGEPTLPPLPSCEGM